jgi:hypothetical protein
VSATLILLTTACGSLLSSWLLNLRVRIPSSAKVPDAVVAALSLMPAAVEPAMNCWRRKCSSCHRIFSCGV